MPYEVLENVLTVHKPLDKLYDKDGESKFWDVEPITYFVGDIIQDEDIAPYVIEAYEAGDEHTTSVLKKVETKEKSVKKETKAAGKDSPKGDK